MNATATTERKRSKQRTAVVIMYTHTRAYLQALRHLLLVLGHAPVVLGIPQLLVDRPEGILDLIYMIDRW